ncbi:MAG TPA: DUF3090 family protein [Dictyobacter sp.]|nr:DUF3090 family protein [Dictyobacter sp.]
MSEDLGIVTMLGADAVGKPGQRRFRIFAHSAHESALFWMEKEQLSGLAEALDRSLALITEGLVLRTEAQAGEQREPEGMPADFPTIPTYEMQVGQMRLNYSDHDSTFSLQATPLDIVTDSVQEPMLVMKEDEAISFTFTVQQAQKLSQTILSVLASGRPLCPFCHTALDGGPHACVKQNGHREIIPIEEPDEEDQ